MDAKKSAPPTPNASAEKSKLRETLAPLYRGSKGYDEMEARGGILGRLSDAQQLMILDDRELCAIKDSKGMTPAYDLARYGGLAAQNRILDARKAFDVPEFRSEWGTPLDAMAIHGKVEVQEKMLDLPIEELTAIRTIEANGMTRKTTLLHELASDSYNQIIPRILKLSKEILMLKAAPQDEDSESVLQVIVSGGGSKAAKELARSLKQQT